MMTRDSAKALISDLIDRFEEQYDSYKKSGYNEALTRKDFIDPFFKALGWDMDNSQGFAEAYREVIHEDKIKISGAMKAPDYSFRLSGGKRLFFVEAKKPHVVVKDEIIPAYQIRRYGWSAKMPISIITDFEEFAVYDCTKKPLPTDKASVARIQYITFRDYLKEFDFIYDTFSKEKVLKGSFDKFVASTANKKGTTTVDKEFLNSLDEWRTYLATSISWNNKDLDEDEINFVVQQTIDRLIFLRIAEDRSVEPYGNLKHSISSGDYYKNLFDIFQRADEKYNSGIFDFKKDKISEGIKVDNKVIKTIINELYYPDSPYEFSVLSVEILGNAYEQFLGKQIRIDSAHRAKIEEKPEVRKAGGVYYTPQYIVDYIVKNTVGKLIEGKTPKEISEITIADIACGSGSFLLGAYQFLLDYHKDYYTRNGPLSKGKKDNPLTPEGHLTTAEKKRILLNNIYGVDIDVNAVEVTKLSLLLKCLEGETEASIATQMSLWRERVLPSLENNIKSGNSLIDVDYYSEQLDFGEEKLVKPFNWQKGFSEVFKKGGFDVVIGNPPYIRIQSIVENSPGQGNYFSKKYQSASKGNYDIYVIFIERALSILNPNGKIGFILPHKFFTAQYGEGIRQLLLSKNVIDEIIHFGFQQIFASATTYTCILTLENKRKKKQFDFVRVDDVEKWKDSEKKIDTTISIDDLTHDEWNFISGKQQLLFNKLKLIGHSLENVTKRIFQGLKTSADKIFIVKILKEQNKLLEVFCPQNEETYEVEKELFHPLIKGGDSRNYILSKTDLLILFPYSNSKLIEANELKEKFPKTYAYLKVHKQYLENRENGKMKNAKWYAYVYPKALDVISLPKLFTPDISPKASFAFDNTGNVFFTGGVSGGYGIIPKQNISEKYLLALLNSKLLDWFLKQISTQMRGGWYSFESKYIKHLPIVVVNNKNKEEIKIQKEIEDYTDQLINLNSEKAATKLESNVHQLQNKIDYCEEKLNQIVYQLYKLSPEEIKIVEDSYHVN
jgi:adenine-specific DNA-methyltransferase